MEALFSAAVGELVSRCLSFLISRYLYTLELSKVEILRKLERALLRIAITVEEAEGRLITDQAILQQLKMLRQEMHKGYYVLDKFRYLDQEERKVSGRRSRSLALSSTSNPGKRFPSSATRRHGRKELEVTLDSVQNMVTDMYEFVAFLKNLPPMFRQPYSMYLLFERCMFGRQAEMERTIYFLLQREPLLSTSLWVSCQSLGEEKLARPHLLSMFATTKGCVITSLRLSFSVEISS